MIHIFNPAFPYDGEVDPGRPFIYGRGPVFNTSQHAWDNREHDDDGYLPQLNKIDITGSPLWCDTYNNGHNHKWPAVDHIYDICKNLPNKKTQPSSSLNGNAPAFQPVSQVTPIGAAPSDSSQIPTDQLPTQTVHAGSVTLSPNLSSRSPNNNNSLSDPSNSLTQRRNERAEDQHPTRSPRASSQDFAPNDPVPRDNDIFGKISMNPKDIKEHRDRAQFSQSDNARQDQIYAHLQGPKSLAQMWEKRFLSLSQHIASEQAFLNDLKSQFVNSKALAANWAAHSLRQDYQDHFQHLMDSIVMADTTQHKIV